MEEVKETISRGVRENRQFIAAGVFILLLVVLLMYLTYVPVPEANRDLIVTITGALLVGSASAMFKLFGDSSKAEEEAQRRVDAMQKKLEQMEAKYNVLKDNYDKLTAMLVDKHIIDSHK